MTPSLLDVRLVRDREGRIRASIDGMCVEIPDTRDFPVALVYVARALAAGPRIACDGARRRDLD